VVSETVRRLMGPDLADSGITPFVHAQLSQPRGGVAIGGLLVAWWLSSHLFESTGWLWVALNTAPRPARCGRA
jgi:hypothetical protein